MTWSLSRFRAGALVEVRSKEEILGTLDQQGCVDGLPFMPEMLAFCGRRFHVRAVAHKTCETAHRTWQGRRLGTAVHLADLRCDGSAHGGCEAGCTLFWKDVWLKPAENEVQPGRVTGTPPATGAYTEAQLFAATQSPPGNPGDEPCYSCQATKLYEATEALAWWDLRQYVLDVVTGNHSAGRVVRALWLAMLRALLRHTPFAWSLVNSFRDWNHLRLTGRPAPSVSGQVRRGEKTPTGRLDLKAGETVRIKSQAEIEKTLNDAGKNRGLSFDPEEMGQYCGRVVKVQSSVTRIIEESNGRMLQMKEPCIRLQGVVCNAEHAANRLGCPRAIPPYWREIWLQRVEATDAPQRVVLAADVQSGPLKTPSDSHCAQALECRRHSSRNGTVRNALLSLWPGPRKTPRRSA